MQAMNFIFNIILIGYFIELSNTLYHAELNNCNNEISSLCGDDEWTPYKDQKCIKLIRKFRSNDEAECECAKFDSSYATLLTIKSYDEQEFIENYTYVTSGIKVGIWLGAQRNDEGQFLWNDGSELTFENWVEGSPSDNFDRACVKMQSIYTMKIDSDDIPRNGVWRDITCEEGNYFICQKLQSWSHFKLQKTLIDTRLLLEESTNVQFENAYNRIRMLEELVNTTTEDAFNRIRILEESTNVQLENAYNLIRILENNPVPIGFIYIQLSYQKEPHEIWPKITWTEVTSSYAGLFFRALGGSSGLFGNEQDENMPRITTANYCEGCNKNSNPINFPTSGTTGWLKTGGHLKNADAINFVVSSGEIRPRNVAMRIWQRTA